MKKIILYLISILSIFLITSCKKTALYEFREYENSLEIVKYNGNATSITLPESENGTKITRIGERAFEGHSELENVTVPDSYEEIASYAFKGCSLKSFYYPKHLKSLEKNALDTVLTDPFNTNFDEIEIKSINNPFNKLWFGPEHNITYLKRIPNGIVDLNINMAFYENIIPHSARRLSFYIIRTSDTLSTNVIYEGTVSEFEKIDYKDIHNTNDEIIYCLDGTFLLESYNTRNPNSNNEF